jgi:CBS domain-containing protein
MQVHEAMTREVIWISPDVTLAEAARTMKAFDVGALPVCAGARLVGIITDRDLAIRATAEGRDPVQTLVSDVMTMEAVCCFEAEPLVTAAHLMRRWQIRRIVVVDHLGALAGILTLTDLALNSREPGLAPLVLSSILRPSPRHDQNLMATPAGARQ